MALDGRGSWEDITKDIGVRFGEGRGTKGAGRFRPGSALRARRRGNWKDITKDIGVRFGEREGWIYCWIWAVSGPGVR